MELKRYEFNDDVFKYILSFLKPKKMRSTLYTDDNIQSLLKSCDYASSLNLSPRLRIYKMRMIMSQKQMEWNMTPMALQKRRSHIEPNDNRCYTFENLLILYKWTNLKRFLTEIEENGFNYLVRAYTRAGADYKKIIQLEQDELLLERIIKQKNDKINKSFHCVCCSKYLKKTSMKNHLIKQHKNFMW